MVNPWLEQKRVRLQRVNEIIHEVGKIEHKQLVATVAWDIGLKEKTLNEYLQTLQTLKKIEFVHAVNTKTGFEEAHWKALS